MILLVVSPPSASAQLLVAAAHDVVNGLSEKVEHIHLSTLNVLKDSWQKRASNHVVMFLDRPDADLANMLSRVPLPVVFLAEDPVESARFLMQKHKLAAVEAVRLAASSYASIQRVVCSASNLLRLSPEQCRNKAVAARQLQAFLAQDEDDDGDQPVVTGGNIAPLVLPAPADNSLALDLLSEALLPFRSVVELQPARNMVFPLGMFMTTDVLGELYRGDDITLVGPARILLYGPYLHLPAGRWRIQARFEVTENLSGNVIKFEALCGHDVVAHALGPLPPGGTYVVKIEGDFPEPREPVQLRIGIQEGAIEGRFKLLDVSAIMVTEGLIGEEQRWSKIQDHL